MLCMVARKCLWRKSFQLQTHSTEINLIICQTKKKTKQTTCETNHHIALLKDCKFKQGYITLQRCFHLFPLVFKAYEVVWDEHPLLCFRSKSARPCWWCSATAGCRLVETQPLSASCTLAGSSVLEEKEKEKKGLFWNPPPPPTTAHSHDVKKTQKTESITLSQCYRWKCTSSCDVDEAGTNTSS